MKITTRIAALMGAVALSSLALAGPAYATDEIIENPVVCENLTATVNGNVLTYSADFTVAAGVTAASAVFEYVDPSTVGTLLPPYSLPDGPSTTNVTDTLGGLAVPAGTLVVTVNYTAPGSTETGAGSCFTTIVDVTPDPEEPTDPETPVKEDPVATPLGVENTNTPVLIVGLLALVIAVAVSAIAMARRGATAK